MDPEGCRNYLEILVGNPQFNRPSFEHEALHEAK